MGVWQCWAIQSRMDSNTFLKQNKAYQSSLNFFADLIQHPSGSLAVPGDLLQPYQTNRSVTSSKENNLMGVIQDVLSGVEESSALQFQSVFAYGVQMQIWRKDSLKPIVAFIDQNLPNLVWFSSKTKAYLFDMTYTDIDRCDLDLEKKSGMKFYFILRYFEEEIPLMFQLQADATKYCNLFINYIKYNRMRQYPPFFSRIMKLYTLEEAKRNISRKKTAQSILNITRDVFEIKEDEGLSLLSMVYLEYRKETLKLESELKTNEIRDYFRIIHCSENLMRVFQKYSETKLKSKLDYLEKPMHRSQFTNFLIIQQKQSAEVAERMALTMKETLNFYEFCTFLQNEKINHAACGAKIEQDLPLTDYFCYSSHNTYLSGNQLTSDSKIERYMEDLERGLKCVELDIHNDGDTPIINHALGDRSLCSPIDFEETIKEIAKFSDSNPKHYPIILSIQNHAKEENRYKVSNILLKYLLKRIFFVNEAYQSEDPIRFKTLKELRGKIIIKTDSKLSQVTAFRKKMMAEIKSHVPKLPSPQPDFPSKVFQQRYQKFQQNMVKMAKRKEDFDWSMPNTLFLPISQMSKVTGLFKSEGGIENSQSKGCECTSLTCQKAQKTKQDKLIDYTRRSFLRIYPLGTQIASSNYDPVPHLKIGAQIIALNTQTKDDYAWMMMSYFTAGRYCSPEDIGYIPKPIHLMSNQKCPSIKKTIKIEIMSDVKSMEIKFFGSERDMKANAKSKKTDTFETVDFEEAFLIFVINESLKECIPIRFIREGYRVLVAKNSLFKDSGIRIIVQISIVQEPFI